MKRKDSIGLPLVKQPKPEKCIACNGSGRYDHNGSPKCASCNGTGINKNE